jgi:hypothetical protein
MRSHNLSFISSQIGISFSKILPCTLTTCRPTINITVLLHLKPLSLKSEVLATIFLNTLLCQYFSEFSFTCCLTCSILLISYCLSHLPTVMQIRNAKICTRLEISVCGNLTEEKLLCKFSTVSLDVLNITDKYTENVLMMGIFLL